MKLARGVYVNVKRQPDGGWMGELRFRITDGGHEMRVAGTDEQGGGGAPTALSRAVAIADKVISNPQVASLLPPGTLLAISTVKSIAKAAGNGLLDREIAGKPLYKHFTGPLGTLARALRGATKSPDRTPKQLSGGPICLADRSPGELKGW